MSLLYRRVSKLPNYVKAFGLLRGIALLLKVERPLLARSKQVRSYEVPWAKAPIWLRDSVSDHAIFWQNMVKRHYDIEQFPHAERLKQSYQAMLREGKRPLIIDAGGNIGLSAIWFALKFPEARILVLEPEAENFHLLSRNIAPYTGIEPIQGGIWARSERLSIQNPAAGAAAFRVESAAADGETGIRAYTVDELLARAGSAEALIVKLDIEGSQSALFRENTGWVGRSHLIMLELDDWLYPWAGTSRSFFECVSRYPFEYLLAGEHICCFRDFSASAGTPA